MIKNQNFQIRKFLKQEKIGCSRHKCMRFECTFYIHLEAKRLCKNLKKTGTNTRCYETVTVNTGHGRGFNQGSEVL